MTDTFPPETYQLPYETDAAFNAFTFYLAMPRPRSVPAAYRVYFQQKHGNKKAIPKQASGAWNNWAVGKNVQGKELEGALTWERRAEIYDKYFDEQLAALRLNQRMKEVEREIEAEDALLKLFNEVLQAAPAFVKSRRVEESNGTITSVIETVGLNVRGLQELTRLHAELMQQRRLTLGMAQKVSELHHGNVEGQKLKIEHEIIDDLIKRARDELKDYEDE